VKKPEDRRERTVAATAQGLYVVPNLKPSVYTIRATFGSFQPLEHTDMTLAAGQEFSSTSSCVPRVSPKQSRLEGRAKTIDLSSARIGANVSEREVQELPVNGRQMSHCSCRRRLPECRTGTWQDIRFSGRAVEQTSSSTTASKAPPSSTHRRAT